MYSYWYMHIITSNPLRVPRWLNSITAESSWSPHVKLQAEVNVTSELLEGYSLQLYTKNMSIV